MAPDAQSISEFVNGRVHNGYSGAMTLEERRRRMREDVARLRSSISPKPRRSVTANNSASNSVVGGPTSAPKIDRYSINSNGVERPATSFEDHRDRYHRRGDRWDTDTEPLDDSSTVSGGEYMTAHQAKVHHVAAIHDFARSPAPEESISESATEEEDDQASVTASIRTEPAAHPLQSLDAALRKNGERNRWSNNNRARTGLTRTLSNSLSGVNGYHPQQHHFSRQSMVGASTTLPYHTRPSTGHTLRVRDTSAPPMRSSGGRPLSPIQKYQATNINGTGQGSQMNGTNGIHEYLMNGSSGHAPMPIDEQGEFNEIPEVVEARSVSLVHKSSFSNGHHQHSFSNMSQASSVSRASSTSDLRALGSGGSVGSRSAVGRFRTKRSHVGLRRHRRNTQVELDYSPQELARMAYKDLAEESFDFGPKNRHFPHGGIVFPDDVRTLEEKIEHVRSLPDNRTPNAVDDSGAPTRSVQEIFFGSLYINEYEECGDHIVGQLAGLVDRLRKLRQAKRKVFLDFEDEVAKREAAVGNRMEGLQKELMQLRRSGQEALTAAIASSS